MAKALSVTFTDNLTRGMKRYFDKVGIAPNKTMNADEKAKTKVGLQLLNWVINGSAKAGVTPPILSGTLSLMT